MNYTSHSYAVSLNFFCELGVDTMIFRFSFCQKKKKLRIFFEFLETSEELGKFKNLTKITAIKYKRLKKKSSI